MVPVRQCEEGDNDDGDDVGAICSCVSEVLLWCWLMMMKIVVDGRRELSADGVQPLYLCRRPPSTLAAYSAGRAAGSVVAVPLSCAAPPPLSHDRLVTMATDCVRSYPPTRINRNSYWPFWRTVSCRCWKETVYGGNREEWSV